MTLALAGSRSNRRRQGAPDLLPVLLFLREHRQAIVEQNDYGLPAVIKASLEKHCPPPPDWFESRLQAGGCLVLLDGLDEVADESERRRVAAWVEGQLQGYPRSRFVITSRPHGYRSSPIAGVTVLAVQPFDQTQVTRFVNNWYRANEVMAAQKDDPGVRMAAEEGAGDLLRRLRTSAPLAELAVNPLLLTMIATVHRYRSSLPGRRVELYAEICEVFLGKRRQARGLEEELTPSQKQLILQPLAYHLMTIERREIGAKEAAAVIAAPLAGVTGSGDAAAALAFLKNVEASSGLLLEREAGEFGFAHLSVQEYLASVHIREQGLESELAGRVADGWWHETIRLYSAQGDASLIIVACLRENPPPIPVLVLALECVEDAREVSPTLRSQLDVLVAEGVEDTDPERRRLVAEVLLARRLRQMVRVSEQKAIDTGFIRHAEYQLFLDEKRVRGEYYQPDHWQGYQFPPDQGQQPVVGVRPTDAIAFCDWLTARESGVWRYRLPVAGETAIAENPSRLDIHGFWTEKGGLFSIERVGASAPTLSIEKFTLRMRSDIALALDRTADSESVRVLGRTLDRASVLFLAPAHFFDRAFNPDLPCERDYNLNYNLNLEVALDLNLALNLELDLALDRDRARALDIALALARDLDRALVLKLDLNLDSTSVRRFLRWLVRLVTLLVATDFEQTLTQVRSSQKWWKGETASAKTIQNLLDEYLDLYIDFAILEERIEGNLPAFEGIRIVRERVTDGV